jgi:hypothetical protein
MNGGARQILGAMATDPKKRQWRWPDARGGAATKRAGDPRKLPNEEARTITTKCKKCREERGNPNFWI